jgi:hypothetical protein
MAEDVALITLREFMARHPAQPGRTLVVGSKCYNGKPDRRALYENALGIDLFDGEGVDVVHDLEQPLPGHFGKFNHVDCVSVLEHVKRPWLMARSIEKAMLPGGTILVCVPFSWRVHGYPSDYYRFTTEALPILFPNIRWTQRKYIVGPDTRRIVPGKDDEEGKWIARSELVGAGVRCR